MQVTKIDRLVYRLCLGYHGLGRAMPLKTWLGMGRRLGALAYRLDRDHRRIVHRNLHLAYGDAKDKDAIRRLARRNFEQWGMIAQELALLKQRPEWLAAHLKAVIDVEGREHLDAVHQEGRPVILIGAHFGNWEFAHLYYAQHIHRINFIVRRIDNPLLEKLRRSYTAALGVNILYKERGLRDAIKKIRAGEDLVIFADQKANVKEGIPCRFFGHRTSTLSIAPALAQKFGAALVPMFMVRTRDTMRHRLIFGPQLPLTDQNRRIDIETLTQRQNDLIEGFIRQYPDHWLWLHRKWKTEFPEMYR
jgi:KDO2-lipid IV(A) lauroyltransferase